MRDGGGKAKILNIKQLGDLHRYNSTLRLLNSATLWWVGDVAIRETKAVQGVWLGKPF
jgi:hypothetical protein